MESINMMSIKQLFEDNKQYIVPIYQRDYAWTHKEAKQLIDDIRDYIRDHESKSYYIGSLVVYSKGGNLYEVVDGQQRFTTLTIMLRALERKGVVLDSKLTKLKLSFEHRDKSTDSLKEGNIGNGDTAIDKMFHFLLKANYSVDCKGDENDCKNFADYLCEKVKILLVEMPKDADLNHYFEIMNTRGEQLEKHEVLKARLMSMLKYDDKKKEKDAHSLFNIIWEACADMDSYAMMNIKADVRNVLYEAKDSNVPQNYDFDTLLDKSIEAGKKTDENKKATFDNTDKDAVTIAAVLEEFWKGNKNLEGYEMERDGQNNEKPERFKSIIDFQNFLLQTLSIYVSVSEDEALRGLNITLDDKQLLQSFERVDEVLENDQAKKTSFAKGFVVFLLRVRSLFDIYVLKSDSNDGNDGKWKIQKYDRSNSYYKNTFESGSSEKEAAVTNSDLEMIQSMFHFSHTSNTYNKWLNAALKYIEENDATPGEKFYDWLWNQAKSYMLEEHLKVGEVYDLSRLDRGCEVENFVFNFYDFIVWKKDKNKYKDFRFTYRTSVEHYYPQHPEEKKYLDEGNSESGNNQGHKQHQKIVDSFGNLCLITSSMNSRFSNLMPKAKYEQYGADNKDVGKQSIKLKQMFEAKSDWDKKAIDSFTKECKCTLVEALGLVRVGDLSEDKYKLKE